VIEAVELAEKEVDLDVVGLELGELLVLCDSELEHLAGLRGLHIAEGAEIDLTEQGVSLNIIGVASYLLLRCGDRLADAADLEVEVGEAILQHGRIRICAEGELVLFDGLGGVVGAASIGGQIFVEVR